MILTTFVIDYPVQDAAGNEELPLQLYAIAALAINMLFDVKRIALRTVFGPINTPNIFIPFKKKSKYKFTL